jgi:uncharacterized coiled-coil protein SlyX
MGRTSTARIRRARPAPTHTAADLERRIAELEALVSSAQDFWRGELEEERKRNHAALERKDAQIAALRRKLNELQDSATRRSDDAPDPRVVRIAWREACAETGSLKAAEAQLQERHGWNPRMVQRVIAKTDALLAEGMGITVARLRELQGRPPSREESSDT